jgi:hypothetical protein
MKGSQRRWAFVLICLMAVAISAAYISLASRSRKAPSTRHAKTLPLERLEPGRPGILFRSTLPDDTFRRVGFVPLDALDGPWYMTALTCERVSFQGGRGVCLAENDGLLPGFSASIFDEHFRTGRKTALAGVPSRTRLSPDGRIAAFTVFVSGDSYAKDGFSTRTTLLDTASGETIANLEDFAVSRDGATFKAVDFNFWGVTFAREGKRLYATLRTGGINYLIEGNIDRREARVIHTGVECPSLSPNGRQIAFKQRASGRSDVSWHVAVLDLTTLREATLDWEQRSVTIKSNGSTTPTS